MPESLDIRREIDAIIGHAPIDRRAKILSQVTDLFLARAPRCSGEEVALFDEIITELAAKIEVAARALLAAKLAPVPNAPPTVIRALAFDDAIEVASPVLTLSERLDTESLVENVKAKSQPHLLAVSRRRALNEAVTDVLVARGDREVVLSAAQNAGARFSEAGFGILINRSAGDEPLAECVGMRADVPPHLFLKLLTIASDRVRAKLEAEHPRAVGEVHAVVAEVTRRIQKRVHKQALDYAEAQAILQIKFKSGNLGEREVAAFAGAGQFEETAVALALLGELPIATVEHALLDKLPDLLLTIVRAIEFSWPTVKLILRLRAGPQGMSATEVEQCLANFDRLKPATARQLITFHRMRGGNGAPRRA